MFEDIPPYVCTSGTCESAVKSFSRRHEWAHHEKVMHGKVWHCPYGCLELIGSSEGFKAHVRTVHHLAYQVEAVRDLTAACGRGNNKEEASACPLCTKSCDSVKRWVKHVGHHLEQLTLFTLPMDLLSQDTPDGSDGRSDGRSDVERDSIPTQSLTTASMNAKDVDFTDRFAGIASSTTRDALLPLTSTDSARLVTSSRDGEPPRENVRVNFPVAETSPVNVSVSDLMKEIKALRALEDERAAKEIRLLLLLLLQ